MTTTHLQLLAISAMFSTLSCAALPAQDDPTAAVVALLDRIDRGLGVAGGAPHPLTIEGTYTITFEGAAGGQPFAEGSFREQFDGRGLAHHRSDLGSNGALERGCSKDLVWEIDPAMGAKVHHGHHGDAVRRFYGVLAGRSPRDLFVKFEAAGKARVDGAECAVLRMTPGLGKPDLWYVDPEGRVARIDTALPSPESSDAGTGLDDLMPATITFADWRKVGDALLPHRRTLKMGPATVAFTCSKLEIAAEMPAKAFDIPAAVAAAAKADAEPAFGADGKPVYQLVERKAQPVASIRIKCKPAELSGQLGIMLPEIMAVITATGGQMAGAPFSRYHAASADEIDIEAGIPVKQPIKEKGRVKSSSLPAGKAVCCWHVGPYHGLSKAHADLAAYLRDQGLQPSGGPWEVYWTDPGMVPDSAKWRTQLFAPIK